MAEVTCSVVLPFATDLKKMFDATMFDWLEAYEVLSDGRSLTIR
jgi:hypothetical protein